jgi:hypothetical protein
VVGVGVGVGVEAEAVAIFKANTSNQDSKTIWLAVAVEQAVPVAVAVAVAVAVGGVVARQPRRKEDGRSKMTTQKAASGVKSNQSLAQMAKCHPKAAVGQLVVAPL